MQKLFVVQVALALVSVRQEEPQAPDPPLPHGVVMHAAEHGITDDEDDLGYEQPADFSFTQIWEDDDLGYEQPADFSFTQLNEVAVDASGAEAPPRASPYQAQPGNAAKPRAIPPKPAVPRAHAAQARPKPAAMGYGEWQKKQDLLRKQAEDARVQRQRVDVQRAELEREKARREAKARADRVARAAVAARAPAAPVAQPEMGRWRRKAWREGKSRSEKYQNKVLAKQPLKMGQGAFGTVMKATAVCDPSQPVAVKILKMAPHETPREFFKMCEGEVAAMGLFVGDRHFVQVVPGEHGPGPKEEKEYSFMMNLARGDVAGLFVDGCAATTLQLDNPHCSSKSPRRGTFARVLEKVFLAVYELVEGFNVMHSRGVIHRDVKPANMMVRCRRDPQVCYPMIGDMGLSCATRANTTGVQTCRRQMAGTPLYMAPEFYASGGDPKKSNDMWSVGLIAYEMVFGKLPAPLRNAMSLDQIKAATRKCLYGVNTYGGCVIDRAKFMAQFDRGMQNGRPRVNFNEDMAMKLKQVIEGLTRDDPALRWTASRAIAEMEPYINAVRNELFVPADGIGNAETLPNCWYQKEGEFAPPNLAKNVSVINRSLKNGMEEMVPDGDEVDQNEVEFDVLVGPMLNVFLAKVVSDDVNDQMWTAADIRRQCAVMAEYGGMAGRTACVLDERLEEGVFMVTKVRVDGAAYSAHQLKENPAVRHKLANGYKATQRGDGFQIMRIVAMRIPE